MTQQRTVGRRLRLVRSRTKIRGVGGSLGFWWKWVRVLKGGAGCSVGVGIGDRKRLEDFDEPRIKV